jgi:sec-independent protein translocase protein TatC
VLGLFLAFGLTFEVPIVVVLLARFGIADVERLKTARPYVIVGAFIVAAIFTPPDVISQLLLAVPLCLLYELGIQIARLVGKRPDVDPAASASGS